MALPVGAGRLPCPRPGPSLRASPARSWQARRGHLGEAISGRPPRPRRAPFGETFRVMDTSDIKKGVKLMQDGQPYVVVDFQFVKPGKGQAFTRTKMKNLLNGGVIERNIRSGEKLEEADAE